MSWLRPEGPRPELPDEEPPEPKECERCSNQQGDPSIQLRLICYDQYGHPPDEKKWLCPSCVQDLDFHGVWSQPLSKPISIN